MRPRTKIQKRAEELSQTLLPLPRHIVDKFSKETPKCNSKVYYAVLEQKKEFSVVRYFSFVKHKKKDNVCREFMQVWVSAHGDDRDRPEELLYSAEPWSLQSTERISRGNQISTSEEYV